MYVFGIFVKYQKVVVCGRAFGSTSCSIDLHDSFSARAMLLLLLLSNIRHKFQVEILPALFFFWLWVALATQGLCGSIGVLGYFCLSLKYVVGVLAGTALNLQVASVRMFFFYNNSKEHGGLPIFSCIPQFLQRYSFNCRSFISLVRFITRFS